MNAFMNEFEDVCIIDLVGFLDAESSSLFRNSSESLKGKKIIFNFSNLRFVGSYGISLFLSNLEELVKSGDLKAYRFCAVSSEFQKILATYDFSISAQYESIHQAISSLRVPEIEDPVDKSELNQAYEKIEVKKED